MALKTSSKWQYFCGANVTLFINDVLIGEAVAVGYNLSQNRTPLYGYNSPHFNAISDGQILVQGKIAFNYVSHEYLLAVIKSPNSVINLRDPYVPLMKAELDFAVATIGDSQIEANLLKNRFWGASDEVESEYNLDLRQSNNFGRPDQHSKSVDIKVYYGDMLTGEPVVHILRHVFFTGRSMDTIITEDPNVETFDFIARSIV